jgi:hypothetical protein
MSPTRRRALLALLGLLPVPALADPPEGRGGGRGNQGGGGQGGNGRGGGGQGNGQGGGQGNPNRGGGNQNRAASGNQNRAASGNASLGTLELNIIQSWLGTNPGFAAQPLPPGMRNRLARGKPLPPGIARRTLPPDLLGLLPAKAGHEYAMVGATLALVQVGTGIVAGLLTDALLAR